MEDNIIWTEMSKATLPSPKATDDKPGIEPCKLESPASLYEYLKEQCNPKRYMSPYNKAKVDVANELYNRLLKTDENKTYLVRGLRDEAIQRLGIVVSTKALYEKLLGYCNPEQFMDPYDFEAVKAANHYYPLIEQCRNDIFKLEDLAVEILYRNDTLKNFHELRNDTEKASVKKEDNTVRQKFEEEEAAKEREKAVEASERVAGLAVISLFVVVIVGAMIMSIISS